MPRRLRLSSLILAAAVSAVRVPASAAGGQGINTAPIPAGTNVLAGRVTELGTDAPIASALVTVFGFFDAAGKPLATLPSNQLQGVPRRLIATPAGEFVVRDLPAGRYAVVAAAFGYISNDFPVQIVEVTDSDRPTIVPVRLWKYASISGTVVDERSEPVVGVVVGAFRRQTIDGRVTLQRAGGALTDDRGAYRFGQLPPGSYIVGVPSTSLSVPMTLAQQAAGRGGPMVLGGFLMASGDGLHRGDFVVQRNGGALTLSQDGRVLTHATTFFPGTVNPSEATVITLASGESKSSIDVPIRLAPGVMVSGVARGPGGAVINIPIHLESQGQVGNDVIEPSSLTALTDTTGRFAFFGVPAGEYTLKGALVMDETPDTFEISISATQPLSIGDSDVTGLTLTLGWGIQVGGRIEIKRPSDATTTPGRPAAILLRPVLPSWRSLRGVVLPDGTFMTPGDPPGKYFLSVQAPPGWSWQAFRGGRPLEDDLIELESEHVTDVLVTFSTKPTHVSGTVADTRGAPAPDATVVVFPADTELWRRGIVNTRRVRQIRASLGANFEIPDLVPGAYYLAAVDIRVPSDWQDPAFLERLIDEAARVTIGEGESKTVALKAFTPRPR